jgi:hypothetical protein
MAVDATDPASGPRLVLHPAAGVPETIKNGLRPILLTDHLDEETRRLTGLGATVVTPSTQPHGGPLDDLRRPGGQRVRSGDVLAQVVAKPNRKSTIDGPAAPSLSSVPAPPWIVHVPTSPHSHLSKRPWGKPRLLGTVWKQVVIPCRPHRRDVVWRGIWRTRGAKRCIGGGGWMQPDVEFGVLLRTLRCVTG